MLYYYLVTIYKGIVGLVTPERLMAVALGALGVYVIWMSISLIASFQRRFNSKCQELINFTIRTKDIEKNPDRLDKMADKISSGFGFGWKKFRNSEVGKPSDFITRREALDVEVTGGILNNGKTMMRAFISFVTVLLAIFNLVYVGGEKSLTFMIFAEALFLPLVFYIVVKLFYFLHSSIKQKLYKMSIESFYEVIDLLDARFAKKGKFVALEETDEEGEENTEEKSEEEQLEENEEKEEEPEEEVDSLDKYDIFKKKNIDIDLDKLLNETPKADATLPFINVDSDYVIKDDDQVGAKLVGQTDNASTIFGGMLQNTSGIKKNNFLDVEKSVAEVDEEKLEKLAAQDEEKKDELDDIFESLAADNKEKNDVKEEIKEEPKEESKEDDSKEEPVIDIPTAPQAEVQEKKFQMEVNRNEVVKPEPKEEDSADDDLVQNTNKFIEIEKNEKDDIAVQEESIANVVSGFKATRSKLASGGMVIERNEPISRRERATYYAETAQETPIQTSQPQPVIEEPVKTDISRPVVEDNTDTVLNALKSAPGTYDNGFANNQMFAPTTNYGSMSYDQSYGYGSQPMYQSQAQMSGYGYGQAAYPNYNQTGYGMGMQEMPSQNYVEEYEDEVDEEVEETEVEKPKKKKTVRTKENEPRPRNLKTSSKKTAKEEPKEMEKRGRPRKQEVSENMVIENDKQFNEVLARAEKLMRKGEEGLSESQTKRIEKEIKILMDAMNRYKESK